MSEKTFEVAKCVIPDCKNKRAAVGKRGPESPIVKAGGDTSKRSSFCRFHLKGRGKEARIKWQTENPKEEPKDES